MHIYHTHKRLNSICLQNIMILCSLVFNVIDVFVLYEIYAIYSDYWPLDRIWGSSTGRIVRKSVRGLVVLGLGGTSLALCP